MGYVRRMGWLVSGLEGYGVAKTLYTIGERHLERGGTSVAYAIGRGPLSESLRESGWSVQDLERQDLASELATPPRSRIDAFGKTRKVLSLREILLERMQTEPVNAIVTCTGSLLNLLGCAAKRAGVPAYWYMAGSVPEGLRGTASSGYYRATLARHGIGLIANSRYSYKSLRVTIPSATIIPPPVNLEQYKTAKESPTICTNVSSSVNVLFGICARLVTLKGHVQFVQAFSRVAEENREIGLVIVGDGDARYRTHLEQLVDDVYASARIRILGFRQDVPSIMKSVNVVVSPSIKPESFGRVCVEGQAAGRPVLATALGGQTETIVDGVTGWLIHEPSVDSMEHGIRRALQDRLRWKEMGKAGQEHVRIHFSGVELADKFIDHVTRRIGRGD